MSKISDDNIHDCVVYFNSVIYGGCHGGRIEISHGEISK